MYANDHPSDRKVDQSTRSLQKCHRSLRNGGIDIVSAAAGGLLAAPMVTLIDMAVTKAAASQGQSLLLCLRSSAPKLVLRPHRILLSRPSLFMFLLYAGTYLTANVAGSFRACSSLQADKGRSEELLKFGAVSTVNVALSLAKDNEFARAFGGSPTVKSLPLATVGSFLVRDGITLFASFNVPASMSTMLPEKMERVMNRLSFAQLAAPVASQLLATPLHLLGLDLYNRRTSVPIVERLRQVRFNLVQGTAIRMCRVLPGLGIGNVVNTRVRDSLSRSFGGA